jgi:phosphoenolpyruvate-protein kinase (PTS system EI component)
LFSQIDSREDLENALATLGEMAGDIDRGEFPFGVGLLLESPSAALSAREWLPLVNGLTIDWDGLSQHLAGPENLPAEVDPLAGCLSPPVLKLLLSLTELARIHGTRLTLCGHLLGEPLWTAVALAIGVRRLSVTPWNFRSAQHTICQISDRGLGELRQLVSEGVPAREIQSWLQQHMHR